MSREAEEYFGVTIHTSINPPDDLASEVVDFGPSMTHQEGKDECDINNIMARYTRTGVLPEAMVGTYGDFSDAVDFHAAQEVLLRARMQFDALDAKVRAKFNNDPAAFLEWIHVPENLKEARELGLLKEDPGPPMVRFAPGEVIKVETINTTGGK